MYDYLTQPIPTSSEIKRMFVLTKEKLEQYKRVAVEVSGGSDSDILIDLIEKLRGPANVVYYVYYNTGLDFDATKVHLKELEQKYGIKIMRETPRKPIPISVKENGQPFLSKKVSEYMERLQAHNFQWEDLPLNVLMKKYPNCQSALKWWCNKWGNSSSFNIEKQKYLKEFIIQNPPRFKISTKCCSYNWENTQRQFCKNMSIELVCAGQRKDETDIRFFGEKTCFNKRDGLAAQFRPLYYLSDEDKKIYKEFFNLTYSDCYELYNFTSIHCAACPLERDCMQTALAIKEYEPLFYKSIFKIFGASHIYTLAYREFIKEKEGKK